MRRREQSPDESTAPLRLQRYRAEEWDGDPQAYWDAVEEWRARGGEDLELLEPGPDVPFDWSRL